jgi:uncharacterized protein (DUF1684 family)
MRHKKPSYLYVIYLAIILVVVILFMLFLVNLDEPETAKQIEKADTYSMELIKERIEKDAKLVDSTTSRFNAEERAMFMKKGLQYFTPDLAYHVMADFVIDTSSPVFQMPTTTERKPNYRIYGYLHFIVKDTLCKLTAYQNMDFKNSPAYDNSLFVPFMDNTNGLYTYGGGRYIDINIPDAEISILDFNKAYNPYCAYSARWSCPLVPFENDLNVSILAGERSYKKEY